MASGGVPRLLYDLPYKPCHRILLIFLIPKLSSGSIAMSFDLVLKPSCEGCGSTSDLYGSNCKHTTLCRSCGKNMAENRGRCRMCGAFITKLIRVCSPSVTPRGALTLLTQFALFSFRVLIRLGRLGFWYFLSGFVSIRFMMFVKKDDISIEFCSFKLGLRKYLEERQFHCLKKN